MLRRREGEVPADPSKEQLLELYQTKGLSHTEERLLVSKLKAEGYNDDEVVMVMRLALRYGGQ